MRRGMLFAILAVLIWSGFIVVSRLGGKSALTPYDMVALRFGVGAVLLLPLWAWRRTRLLDGRLLRLGLIGALGYALLAYWGFRLSSALHAAVLLPGLLPFLVPLLLWWLLGELPAPAKLVGLALIAAGVGCVAVENFAGAASGWGDVLLVGSALCWAWYSVTVKRYAIHPLDATIGSALWAALCFMPVYWLLLPSGLAAAPWGAILLQAFYQGALAVVVTMLLYLYAVEHIGAARMGAMMALVPALSGVLALWLLAEPLSGWLLAGLVLSSAGAWLAVRPPSFLSTRSFACLTSISRLPAREPRPSRRPN
ncbi:DMT family transporter [Pseudogulbenkiania subflava]|uniref:Threonine/homoserine efflux transporter RhtA n=1 Tax=Pseudogulbenkiania subflava DSM 22618 TaxID=1123014 RepID=A0A1Y6BA79_9NEIS|nr:DMT family transporter [Pseudogulbenkiania subflava]SME92954.1 Threonine/homoserine efflux transporter RhtA [Pseudogulbenkiania subflava DSM 22618]